MAVRLLPWAPEYGAGMQFDADAGEGAAVPVDTRVERDVWAPVTPEAASVAAVQIVDGVRRAEAHALDEPAEPGDGMPVFGLFGSFAVGAVRCEPGAAVIREDCIRVERRYLHTGAESAPDVEIVSGRARMRFASRSAPEAQSANDLVATLNRAMLDEETLLALDLARDETAITVVDGSLRARRVPEHLPGRRLVGYIKRIQQFYVGREDQLLLQTLAPGERTPVFFIPEDEGDRSRGRYSWFIRLAHLEHHFHYLGGLARVEAPGGLPVADAVRLADETAVLLPRLASSPARDPRAPQNLVPVGRLESVLTHRLGDRAWVRRTLSAALAAAVTTEGSEGIYG